MSNALAMDNSNVNAIMVEELTTLLLRLSNDKVDQDIAMSLAMENLENLDLDNPFVAHKGLTWIAEQIINTVKL